MKVGNLKFRNLFTVNGNIGLYVCRDFYVVVGKKLVKLAEKILTEPGMVFSPPTVTAWLQKPTGEILKKSLNLTEAVLSY